MTGCLPTSISPLFPRSQILAWTKLILRYIFKMRTAWNKNRTMAKYFLKVVLKMSVGIESKSSLNVFNVGGSLRSVLQLKGDLKCSLSHWCIELTVWDFWSELQFPVYKFNFFQHLRLNLWFTPSSTEVNSQTCTKNIIKPYGLLWGLFLKSKPYCFQQSFAFRFGFVWNQN